jgi:hypothetical protein
MKAVACMMCHHAREAARFGNLHISVRCQLERAREQACLRTVHPWYRILTGAVPDCGPQLGGTSPALGWTVIAVKPTRRGSPRWRYGQTSDKNTSKCMSKHHFLRLSQKFKKIWNTFLQE